MKLDPSLLRKADDKLREVLQTADRDALVRVVMILDPEAYRSDRADTKPEPRPSEFSSRAKYRHELIQRRKHKLNESIGDTLEMLRHLSLKITGGEIGRAIVAEGSVEQIAKGLELPRVTRAMLDQPIELIAPRRGKK